MRKWIMGLGVIAIGGMLFILSLLPAEFIINSSPSGSSESYTLKGSARFAALVTGVIAFVLGMFVARLWIKWIGKK